MKRPLITLLTDFGTADHYVAAMKGVILTGCPGAELIDITHEIGAFSIPEAAWTLAQAAPCFPPGTVHLVVVDPGVGSARRRLAASAGGHFFIAPDNGVLTVALESGCGAVVYQISDGPWFRQPVSRTFHGRDIFAPAAARLAAGSELLDFGPRVHDWIQLPNLRPTFHPAGYWEGIVLRVDHFGNAVTNFPAELLERFRTGQSELLLGSASVRTFASAYVDAPAGQPFLIAGSAGNIEVSLARASAAAALGLAPGMPLRLVMGTGTGVAA